jgi:NADH:ubiquinone oxidoreductase subunit 4 (subunit M)
MLSILIGIPLFGSLVLGLWPKKMDGKWVRWSAVAVMSAALIWSIVVLLHFDLNATGMQLSEYEW